MSAEIADFVRMPTATTRKKRPGEEHGKDKYFLSNKEFDELIEQDGFVEWQWIHGDRYGVLKKIIEERIEAGKDFYADIETLGALKLKEIYGADAVLIFILPPSLKALQSRIDNREGESREEKKVRLQRSKAEMTYLTKSDNFLINDDLEKAAQDLKKIIKNSQKESKERKSNAISVKARALVKFSGGILALKKGEGFNFPQAEIKSDKFPHEELKEQLEEQWGGKIRVAKSPESLQNKGINLFQPFWVDVACDKSDKTEIIFYYLVSPEKPLPQGDKFKDEFVVADKKALGKKVSENEREQFLKELEKALSFFEI